MRKIYLSILICLATGFCAAQQIENIFPTVEGDKIIITYDIALGDPKNTYDVQIYSSFNNFYFPLQNVSGDVGRGITGGFNKKIIWEAKTEIANFKGDITFEVRAEVVSVLAFGKALTTNRRGTKMPLIWQGGRKSEDLTIQLLKGGAAQTVIGQTPNSGSYSWKIPAKQKKASDYQIQLTNGNQTIVSGFFKIKNRTPFIVKFLPFVAAGAVAAVVLGGSNTTPVKPSDNKLDGPPDLGLN